MYDITRSIVRIIHTADPARAVGTGFLVAPGVVATCAHVIEDAQARPGGMLPLQPCGGGAAVLAEVLEAGYSPREQRDTAFLRLSAPLPGADPAPLAGAERAEPGHPFTTYGFARTPLAEALRPYGTINGLVRGKNGADLLQITGEQVWAGISGAPVFDMDLDCVVAMVSQGWDSPTVRVAFAVPVETLAALYPGLELRAPAAPGLPPLPADPAKLPEPGALPPGSTLPFARNTVFTGREGELKALARALLWGGETVAVCQPASITGLGGVGKTQLAVEFAHRYGRFFEGVHWVPAAAPTDIAPGLAACGLAMGVSPWPDGLPAQEAATVRALAGARRRLVILDNLEDPALLADLLPKLGAARVLVTARRADWPPELGVRALPLETLPRAESLALLRKLAPHLKELPDAALDPLADRLGDLPLALDLAGRYLHECAPLSPGEFLAELCRAPALAHPALVDWTERTPTRHAPSLVETFSLSWTRLQGEGEAHALARRVFFAAGWCAPNTAIPLEVLTRALGLEKSTPVFRRALTLLANLGLAKLSKEGPLLHPLLAEFSRRLQGEETEALTGLADALSWISKDAVETGLPAAFLPLRPHLEACAPSAETAGVEDSGTLWNNLAYHLNMVADYPTARAHIERALAIDERVYGKDHPDVAIRLNNLGLVLHALGDMPAARDHFERALAIVERVYGEDHPNVAIRLNNLGMVLKDLGDLPAARAHIERALAIDERVYGKDHLDVATDLSNLGTVLRDLGDLPAARAHLERALAIVERVHGKDHPTVARDLNNLGLVLKDLGELPAARDHYERALAIVERVYGEDHPEMAIRLNNLGMVLQDLGELPAARDYLERALAIDECVYGKDHPDVARDLNNLGWVLQALGELPAARDHYERALAIGERVFGKDHPTVATRLNNLGALLYTLGDLPAARDYLERALAILEKWLPPDHPNIQTVRDNLEDVIRAMGENGGPFESSKLSKG